MRVFGAIALVVLLLFAFTAWKLGLVGAGVIFGLVLLLALSGRTTVWSGNQTRQMRWRIRLRLRPGRGFATLPELVIRWSRWSAALGHGKRARPSMGLLARIMRPATEYAIRLGRGPYFRRCYARSEDAMLVIAPPRVGKTAMMADQAIDHPGPGLFTETRPDIYEASAGYRSRLGPVHLFNPEGVGGYPCTFRWNLLAGCEDPAEAMRRAEDLVGAAVGESAGEMQWWVEKSATALGAGMHAGGLSREVIEAAGWAVGGAMAGAARLGATMNDVWAWANAPTSGAELVQQAMRNERASQAIFYALTELDKPGKTADSIRITMSKSLMWLAVPALADMVCGAGAAAFDVPRWLMDCGSIYMLSPGGENALGAPLFRCFASYVHREARMFSQHLPGRRLDPRLLMLLDEFHMCPIPADRWTADSAGFGIDVRLVVHSPGQLRAKLGQAGLETVWQNCTTKVFLPGTHDVRVLEDVSRLSGRLPGDSGDGRNDWVAPLELIARLPNWRALVIRGNLFPVVVKVRAYWRRWAFRLRLNPPLPDLTSVQAADADTIEREIAAILPDTVSDAD